MSRNFPTNLLAPNRCSCTLSALLQSAEIALEDSPPTFHEIRSLAGRLYEREKGKEFAMKLLGHKSVKMTDKYLDTRGKEYVML
ncbi:tyrosine-type recombinase/integrase [Serratia oryzae]|uniref:tyrosine-type recombinase/integrase n=1 Tax=Serratia oryzae TaxID=2034155 RepID=UPI0012F3D05C